ncbi:MAG: PspC domain-containing protein [Candidatus Aenigmarchaeota archaeon]|nr:PspC domain-containing protein [Candidatus Aenigmarchaeota archaeon]
MSPVKKLYRSGKNKIIGGVCGGLGEFFGIDPTVVRLLWCVLALVYGVGILFYILAWVIVPRNPKHTW